MKALGKVILFLGGLLAAALGAFLMLFKGKEKPSDAPELEPVEDPEEIRKETEARVEETREAIRKETAQALADRFNKAVKKAGKGV